MVDEDNQILFAKVLMAAESLNAIYVLSYMEMMNWIFPIILYILYIGICSGDL